MDERLRGLSLPALPQEEEETYLIETEDGFLVNVPGSRLDAWEAAQRGGVDVPDSCLRRIRDGIKRRIWGSN